MNKVKLTNRSNDNLFIALEPEGDLFELPNSKYIEISLDEKALPMELVFQHKSGQNIIAIWPNYGFSNVFNDGEKL